MGDVPVLEPDAARGDASEAGDGSQHGGLARPVGADEADDLALGDGQRDALERLDLAVVDVEILHLKQHRWAPPDRP